MVKTEPHFLLSIPFFFLDSYVKISPIDDEGGSLFSLLVGPDPNENTNSDFLFDLHRYYYI